jgi:putative addiction module killer protein
MELTVRLYQRPDGTCPFSRWRKKLSVPARARVDTVIARLRGGNTSNVKWFDGIGELKIEFGPGYRVYLLKDGLTLIILLCGGDKSTQQEDVKFAKHLRDEYKKEG